MPLTPEAVKSKEFGVTRIGRTGYVESEVDDFLDEVYDELSRLIAENESLRARLAEAERALDRAGAGSSAVGEAAVGGPDLAAGEPGGAADVSAAAGPAPVLGTAPAAGDGGGDAAQEATGILALAQRTAEEHVAAARAQADGLVTAARERAEGLDRDADERQRRVLGELEQRRTALERTIEDLRAFEREYRSRLRAYLQAQLGELDAAGPDAESGDGSRPAATTEGDTAPGGDPELRDRPAPAAPE